MWMHNDISQSHARDHRKIFVCVRANGMWMLQLCSAQTVQGGAANPCLLSFM